MKNVKMGMFALIGIFGFASAFTNAQKHFNGTTYYGVTDSHGGFTWTKVQPSGKTCDTDISDACTIVTINGFSPVANQLPTSTQATTLSEGLYR